MDWLQCALFVIAALCLVLPLHLPYAARWRMWRQIEDDEK